MKSVQPRDIGDIPPLHIVLPTNTTLRSQILEWQISRHLHTSHSKEILPPVAFSFWQSVFALNLAAVMRRVLQAGNLGDDMES